MDFSRMYSKKIFFYILGFVLIVSIFLNLGLFFLINWLTLHFSIQTELTADNNSLSIMVPLTWASNFYKVAAPSITGLFLLFGGLFWAFLRTSMLNMFRNVQSEKVSIDSKEKSKGDFVEQKIERDRKMRLFLYSLSVFQREGRLLDFFSEDLSLYSDDQIGVAVRSIQEDCKRTIKKYIDPKPVIEKQEGDTIVVEAEFDIDSITLVGKVSGAPPFKGILKHRGWKAGKNEVPKLSDIRDASVIIPAEIEIQ